MRRTTGPRPTVNDNGMCKDMPDVLEAALSEDPDMQRFRDALREIVECRSAYSLDPLERAVNAVEHCQMIAMRALRVGPFVTTEGGKP